MPSPLQMKWKHAVSSSKRQTSRCVYLEYWKDLARRYNRLRRSLYLIVVQLDTVPHECVSRLCAKHGMIKAMREGKHWPEAQAETPRIPQLYHTERAEARAATSCSVTVPRRTWPWPKMPISISETVLPLAVPSITVVSQNISAMPCISCSKKSFFRTKRVSTGWRHYEPAR